ncbi:hypothetical protein [Pseudomonas sp. MWU12-2037]|uniref:hypothetical protein n=1 Tax=Pseudomonas sp. MWU12-2037 TaxID=2928690 RepID=UPI00200CBC03|nr:hypothetical protein [Pseudomonas sp. MWU12-2037]
MFRLNDAVRRYQAQHQPRPVLRCVANLSPCARPATAGIVATVAAVATHTLEPAHIRLLIQQLREEGMVLQHNENTLLIRPTHWQQLDRISSHWKALLRFLQDNENGEADGFGRSA